MSRSGHGWDPPIGTALLGTAFEVLPCAAAVIDTSGEPFLAHVNRAFCLLLGRRPEELAMRPLTTLQLLAAPEDQRRLLTSLRRNETTHLERVDVRRLDGSHRSVDAGIAPMQAEDASSFAVLALLERDDVDASEVVAARELGGSAHGAILGIDSGGLIALANVEAETLFGYGPRELVGQPVATLLPSWRRPGHPTSPIDYFYQPRFRRAGKTQHGRRRDGTQFAIQISVSTARTSAGTIGLASVRDLTNRLTAQSVTRGQTHRRETLSALLGVEEAERSRIATSLHDDTIQVFTASLLALDKLARAARRDPSLTAMATALEDVRAVLAEATERTRRLTFELRPTVLRDRGIAAAVRALTESLRHETGVEAELCLTEERYDWAVEELVYRTIQEAVSNVRKHARANRVTIAVRGSGSLVTGEVSDDGCGFDVERAADREQMALHQGLDAMSERVHMAGGQITIESAAGRGTRVRFELPTFDDV
jgi:PAS domain S-box-containing protein